jgi:hypothetical protein
VEKVEVDKGRKEGTYPGVPRQFREGGGDLPCRLQRHQCGGDDEAQEDTQGFVRRAQDSEEHTRFKGPTAIAFSFKDAALTAKTLTEFVKEEPNLDIKVGTLGAKVLELAEIKNLALLPSRDELLAKLMGVLTNVPAGLVGVLSGVPRKLLYVLNAVGKEK